MTFLLTGSDTRGELLRIDMGVRPGGFVTSEHVHPHQEERFRIANGEITLRIRGAERRYRAGEQVAIPPGTAHIWWNSGNGNLRVILGIQIGGSFRRIHQDIFRPGGARADYCARAADGSAAARRDV